MIAISVSIHTELEEKNTDPEVLQYLSKLGEQAWEPRRYSPCPT